MCRPRKLSRRGAVNLCLPSFRLFAAGWLAGTAWAGAEPLSPATGVAAAVVSEATEEIPVRDASRMMFISPPYGQGHNVECFPYRALDENAEFRGVPLQKKTFTVLTLENAHVRLDFLPALGGRLWKAWCKRSGRPLFKSGTVLERQNLWKTGCGYMTTTMGLRFDFPEWGHDPSAEQPWHYETGRQDGKAWVQFRFRELRSQLEITERIALSDDSAAWEISTDLSNSNDEPRPYKYWTIAYVPLQPDSRVIAPCAFMMYHSGEQVWTWPVSGGADISTPARWAFDTSYFAAGLRYGFAAVHSRSTRSGVARVFPLDRAQGCKLYSEGSQEYVNFYGGVAGTMEELLTLPPRGRHSWTERYYPLEGLEGLTLAGACAALHASLPAGGQTGLAIRIMAVEKLDARLSVRGEGIAPFDAPLAAGPLDIQNFSVPVAEAAPGSPVAIEVAPRTGPAVAWQGTRRDLMPVAVATSAAVAVGAEALANGGFEEYDEVRDRLTGWTPRVWEASGELAVADIAFEGRHSLALHSEAQHCKIGYYSDRTRVTPGGKYRLRFAYQAQKLKTGWGDRKAHVLVTDAAGWNVVAKIEVPEAETGWMTGEASFAIPNTIAEVCVFLQLFVAGSVWFDDVSLTRLPDDAALLAPVFTGAGRAPDTAPIKREKKYLEGMTLAGRPLVFKLARDAALLQPFGLASDGRDNLYCFDGRFGKWRERTSEFCALQMAPDGKIVKAFGGWGDGPGKFFHPGGFAVSPKGEIYVADAGHDRISVFSPAGVHLRDFGESGSAPGRFDGPARLALTAEGSLLVSDVGNARVVEHDADGRFKRVVAGPEVLSAPYDVAVAPSGRIYVADAGAHRVVMLEADGKPAGSIGGYGLEPGRFVRPALLALSAEGDLFVADTALARVSCFDGQGACRRVIGGVVGEFQHFRDISGLALNSRGQLLVLDGAAPEALWICDPRSGQVKPASLAGRAYDNRPTVPRFTAKGAALAPDGDLVFFMNNGYDINILRKCGPDGTLRWELGSTGSGPAQFRKIGQVAFDAAGNIWVLDRGNARLQCFAPDGRYLKAIGRQGSGEGELSVPCDVAVGPGGLIYVSDAGNHRVQALDADGKSVRSFARGADFFPGPLLVARGGDVWVRNMPDGALHHFAPDGRWLGRVDGLGVESTWAYINPMAEMPDGRILVADLSQRRFVCVTPEGKCAPAPIPWPGDTAEVAASIGVDFNCETIAFDHENCLVVAGSCDRGSSFAVVRIRMP